MTAFGVNASSAAAPGDRVIEEHHEMTLAGRSDLDAIRDDPVFPG